MEVTINTMRNTNLAQQIALVSDTVQETEDALLIELDNIIQKKRIRTLFQPIFDLNSNKVFGYEALSRGPKYSPLHMPEDLFNMAREHQRLFALECVCRETAIKQFLQMGAEERLCLNVEPLTLMDPSFREGMTMRTLRDAGLPYSRVVIELTEHAQIGDMESLKQAVAHYRNMGFAIALDDLSAGYSNLQLMAELRPEYIKLDIYFTRKLADDEVARGFARAIADMAGRVGSSIIAEGIESVEVLREVNKLGLDLAQGYLLGRPSIRPDGHIPEQISRNVLNREHQSKCEADNISHLCHAIDSCSPTDQTDDLLKRFQQDVNLLAVPVVEHGKAIGMVRRESLLRQFAMPFGRDLHARRPVRNLMWKTPLIVSADMPVEVASELATSQSHEHMYAPIIVEDADGYMGMVFVHDLLEHMTQHRIEQAMNANPLTRLPGNLSIEHEISQRLKQADDFILCYVDLDNFKAFNDRYGYKRGDAMLKMLGNIIKQTLAHEDFAGHIGGDDFIIILQQRNDWEAILHTMMHTFSEQSRTLYDDTDAQNGYITSKSRSGEIQEFPLASLSIGALPCPPGCFSSHLETAEIASELKCQAKKTDGNHLEVDRRAHPVTYRHDDRVTQMSSCCQTGDIID